MNSQQKAVLILVHGGSLRSRHAEDRENGRWRTLSIDRVSGLPEFQGARPTDFQEVVKSLEELGFLQVLWGFPYGTDLAKGPNAPYHCVEVRLTAAGREFINSNVTKADS